MNVYACKNIDLSARLNSTSGGVFPIFAKAIIAKGGKVYGVEFDENFATRFNSIITEDQIDKFCGSKYPQAKLGNIFCRIKKDLDEGLSILFVGTPCQVAGLVGFLGRDYNNLYCIDFICYGVASPKAWDSYLCQTFKEQKIEKVKFKDKRTGWHTFSTVVTTNKTCSAMIGSSHPFMQAYLRGYTTRPSCYKCRFKGIENRKSDITISDCWGIEKFYPKFDDDNGVSAVFVNTLKGMKLYEQICNEVSSIDISFSEATQYNPFYFDRVQEPKNRQEYFEILKTKNYFAATKWMRKSFGIEENVLKSILKKLKDVINARIIKK